MREQAARCKPARQEHEIREITNGLDWIGAGFVDQMQLQILRQNVPDNISADVRQSKIPSGVAVGEFLVVEP